MDNIFTERLWRTVKYENIYTNKHATISEVREGPMQYFRRYNTSRPHHSLEFRTPH